MEKTKGICENLRAAFEKWKNLSRKLNILLTNFKNYVQAVEGGTFSDFQGTGGLSDYTDIIEFTYDIEDSDNNDANAPYKPGSTTDRFDQWQYYYLYHITDALNTLGFTPDGVTWPVIEDDG